VANTGELIDRFLVHLHDRFDGGLTWKNFRSTLEQFRLVAGHLLIEYCTPPVIEIFRDALIKAGRARTHINKEIYHIRRMLKWGVSEGFVPHDVYYRVQAMEPLLKWRCAAMEPEPIGPVEDAVVEATLAHLRQPVADMVRFQRLTSCRPGEACRLAPIEIDRCFSPGVWAACPGRHKTAWRGQTKVIVIGPQAQEILAPWMQGAWCFPSPTTGKPYWVTSYDKAVQRAALRAGVPLWTPNQLRHSRGTEIRKLYSLEGAQVILGHTRADMTERYAEKSLELAAKIALETG
jgi:integrase